MAPIFYCSCTNCSCTATVLLTQTIEKEREVGDSEEEDMLFKTNKSNCGDVIRRKEYVTTYLKPESQTSEFVETFILFAGGALLLLGKA